MLVNGTIPVWMRKEIGIKGTDEEVSWDTRRGRTPVSKNWGRQI